MRKIQEKGNGLFEQDPPPVEESTIEQPTCFSSINVKFLFEKLENYTKYITGCTSLGDDEVDTMVGKLNALLFEFVSQESQSVNAWIEEILSEERFAEQVYFFDNLIRTMESVHILTKHNKAICCQEKPCAEGAGAPLDKGHDLTHFGEFINQLSKVLMAEKAEKKVNLECFFEKFNATFKKYEVRGTGAFSIPALMQILTAWNDEYEIFLLEDIAARNSGVAETLIAQSVGQIHQKNKMQAIVEKEDRECKRKLLFVDGKNLASSIEKILLSQVEPLTKEFYIESLMRQKQGKFSFKKNEDHESEERAVVQDIIEKKELRTQSAGTSNILFLKTLLTSIEKKKSEDNQQVALTFEISEKLEFFLKVFKQIPEGQEKTALEERLREIRFDLCNTTGDLLRKIKNMKQRGLDCANAEEEIESEIRREIHESTNEISQKLEELLSVLPRMGDLNSKDAFNGRIDAFLSLWIHQIIRVENIQKRHPTIDLKHLLTETMTQFCLQDYEKTYILHIFLRTSLKLLGPLCAKAKKTNLPQVHEQLESWAHLVDEVQKKGRQDTRNKIVECISRFHTNTTLKSDIGTMWEHNLGVYSVRVGLKSYFYKKHGSASAAILSAIEEEFLPVTQNSPVDAMMINGENYALPEILYQDIHRIKYSINGKEIKSQSSDRDTCGAAIQELIKEARQLGASQAAVETLLGIANQGPGAVMLKAYNQHFFNTALPDDASSIEKINERMVLVGVGDPEIKIDPLDKNRSALLVTYRIKKRIQDIEESSEKTDPLNKPVNILLQVNIHQDGTVFAEEFSVATDTMDPAFVSSIVAKSVKSTGLFGLF